MEASIKNRRKAKILKIVGSVLFVIEFFIVALAIGYIGTNFKAVNQFNYYDKLIENEASVTYDDSVVYGKNDNAYAYKRYFYYDKKLVIYSTEYVLDSYDSSYYYFKNDEGEMKLENMTWLTNFILKCETSINSGLTENVTLYSEPNDIISFGPSTKYHFYDDGDTVKVSLLYQVVEVYKASSHNSKYITFDYYKSFYGNGVDTIEIIESEKVNNSFEAKSYSIIDKLNTEYYSKDIIEGFPFLSIITKVLLHLGVLVIVFFLTALYLALNFLFLATVKRSFSYVSSNNNLRITGVILFIFISGALLYFGARLDEDAVDEIEAERIRKEQEERKQDELAKKNNITVIKKPDNMPKIALVMGFIGALSFSIGIYFLFGPLISGRIILGIYYKFDSSQPTSYLFWGFVLIVVCSKLLKNHIAQRAKYEKAMQTVDEGINQNVCRNCGALLGEDSLFCYACGTKVERIVLEEDVKICKHCGGIVSKDAIFCRSCGKRLDDKNDDSIEEALDEEINLASEDINEDTLDE